MRAAFFYALLVTKTQRRQRYAETSVYSLLQRKRKRILLFGPGLPRLRQKGQIHWMDSIINRRTDVSIPAKNGVKTNWTAPPLR